MPGYVTKDHFDSRLDGVVATIRGDIRDVISHFNKSQAEQNARLDRMDFRFDQMDVKLDAVLTLNATRSELRTLIHQLNERGMQLNESEIISP